MSDIKVNENPYREGQYREIFDEMRKRQVFSKAELIQYVVMDLGLTYERAKYSVTILMSPRKISRIGDCRGSISACGHLYYMEKLPRQMRCGMRDPQKFRLRWRENPLEPRNRVAKLETESLQIADLKEIARLIRAEGIVKKVNSNIWKKLVEEIK